MSFWDRLFGRKDYKFKNDSGGDREYLLPRKNGRLASTADVQPGPKGPKGDKGDKGIPGDGVDEVTLRKIGNSGKFYVRELKDGETLGSAHVIASLKNHEGKRVVNSYSSADVGEVSLKPTSTAIGNELIIQNNGEGEVKVMLADGALIAGHPDTIGISLLELEGVTLLKIAQSVYRIDGNYEIIEGV